MGIVMYVFDARYPIRDVKPGLHGNKTVRKVVVGPTVPLPETVKKVIDALKSGETIELLRLCAHGDSGGLILGSGLVTGNVTGLGPLEPYMDKGEALRTKRVQIHGCGVASDTSILKDGADPVHPKLEDLLPGTYGGRRDRVGFGGRGYTFLLSVAVCLMTKVQGAVNFQSANPAFLYQGKTILVDPDGTTQVIEGRATGSGPALVPDAD